MTNKRKNLIERLHGSLSGWNDTVNQIIDEEIFDENGFVDSELLHAIMTSAKDSVSFASASLNALIQKLGGPDNEQPKSKKDTGAKWTVEEILKHCELRDNVLYLPNVQLDKKAYQEAKRWIEEAGGKWSTKQQGFTFDFNADRVCGILLQGKRYNLKQKFQYFGTPDAVADRMAAKFSSLSAEMSILEPSAGRGALVRAIRRRCPDAVVDCFELMPENMEFLKKEPGANILGNDFAECVCSYDRIIANPPFSNNQDIDHVYKMYDHLKPGGELSVIVSQHWQIATDKKCTEFCAWLEKIGAVVENIEANAFKESGTIIGTTLLFIKKGE